MKKLLSMALALAMTVSLAACGGKPGGTASGSQPNNPSGGQPSGETIACVCGARRRTRPC